MIAPTPTVTAVVWTGAFRIALSRLLIVPNIATNVAITGVAGEEAVADTPPSEKRRKK